MLKKIVFVCVENSNRSQMAEAFARIHGSDKFEAFSAGSRPSGRVNPKAIEAMKELGYDLTIHGSKGLDAFNGQQVEVAVKYEGYIERQRVEIARHRAQEDLALPRDLDYRSVRGLSTEVQQKLNLHRPETIGHASRISGMTPAAIALLLVHLRRGFRTAAVDAGDVSGQRSA